MNPPTQNPKTCEEVPPYSEEEIMILVKASRKKQEPFYEDLSDYIQFCRSGLVRPGTEVLSIRHKDIHMVPMFLEMKTDDNSGWIYKDRQTTKCSYSPSILQAYISE